jgi:hypothetical protein
MVLMKFMGWSPSGERSANAPDRAHAAPHLGAVNAAFTKVR